MAGFLFTAGVVACVWVVAATVVVVAYSLLAAGRPGRHKAVRS